MRAKTVVKNHLFALIELMLALFLGRCPAAWLSLMPRYPSPSFSEARCSIVLANL